MIALGTITAAIDELKKGDEKAAHDIYVRYFNRILDLAGGLLYTRRKAVADEEDVAISVFESLFVGAAQGRFTILDDRADLWLILFVMTKMKASNLNRDSTRQKRDSRKTKHASTLASDPTEGFFDKYIGDEPTPEFLVSAEEEFQRLLDKLNDERLADIAIKKMDGYTNAEIAKVYSVNERTVSRYLLRIRNEWLSELADE